MVQIIPSQNLVLKRLGNLGSVDVQRCELEAFIQLMSLILAKDIYNPISIAELSRIFQVKSMTYRAADSPRLDVGVAWGTCIANTGSECS